MKQNYDKKMNEVTTAMEGRREKLLLQSCCGPCSSAVLERLQPWFDVTILFYNPNIQPEAEYNKRLAHQQKLLAALPFHVELLPVDWQGSAFDAVARGLEAEPEGGKRCTACFLLRLEETARLAARLGFDRFCTTLTVSPHKDAQRINAIGEKLGEKYGVAWLPSDFKKREGYKRSIELSRQYALYRQDYCGCLFSKSADAD